MLSRMSCNTFLVAKVYRGHCAAVPRSWKSATRQARFRLRTSRIQIVHEIDIKVRKLVGKRVLDWIWDRAKDQRELGTVEH